MKIDLMIDLNDLEVKLGTIMNTYVQAPVTEKMWTSLGPEFGKYTRKTSVIVGASCSPKSAGAAFRSNLAKCMKSLGYQPCKADPDFGLNQKSDQKMRYRITHIYCAMLMTLYVSSQCRCHARMVT